METRHSLVEWIKNTVFSLISKWLMIWFFLTEKRKKEIKQKNTNVKKYKRIVNGIYFRILGWITKRCRSGGSKVNGSRVYIYSQKDASATKGINSTDTETIKDMIRFKILTEKWILTRLKCNSSITNFKTSKNWLQVWRGILLDSRFDLNTQTD